MSSTIVPRAAGHAGRATILATAGLALLALAGESLQAQQLPVPSRRADSTRVDSLRVDSLRVDSLRLDSLRNDSLRTDSSGVPVIRNEPIRVGPLTIHFTGGDSARSDSARAGTAREQQPVPAADSALAAPGGGGADSAARADSNEAESRRPAIDSAPSADRPSAPATGGTSRDPLWPVPGPEPLPGAVLPHRRIVAYYGNPLSTRMGILGEVPPDSMLKLLDTEVAAWEAADPDTPVQPALHLVTVVAQADSGQSGKYRLKMSDSLIERVASWAERRSAIMFLDVQVGLSTLEEELPRLAKFLERPHFNLAIDPEFMMKDGSPPGKRLGYTTAEDVNYAIRFLADIIERHGLPPKVLVLHRFTNGMLRNVEDIELDPRVQVVIHMDGWGPPRLKRDSYREYVYKQPVQFTGFKVFYKNDTRQGHAVMTPAEILTLFPAPLYIQYQ